MIGDREVVAGAPLELLQATAAVRVVLLQSGSGQLYGCCIQACLILGWILKQRGYPNEMWSCTPNGWPHWCVRVDEWILNPAAGQFGDADNPLLIFREGSPEHWYEPGRDEPLPISEQQIIETFADWIEHDADPDVLDTIAGRGGAILELLELAGLAHREGAVREAGD